MKVWVVLEECRGQGASVVKVFTTLSSAKKFLEDCGWSCYLNSEEGEEVFVELTKSEE